MFWHTTWHSLWSSVNWKIYVYYQLNMIWAGAYMKFLCALNWASNTQRKTHALHTSIVSDSKHASCWHGCTGSCSSCGQEKWVITHWSLYKQFFFGTKLCMWEIHQNWTLHKPIEYHHPSFPHPVHYFVSQLPVMDVLWQHPGTGKHE